MQFTSFKLFAVTTAIAFLLGSLLFVVRNFHDPLVHIPIGILATIGIFGSPILLPLLGFAIGRRVLELREMDMVAFVLLLTLVGPIVSVLCFYVFCAVLFQYPPTG